MIDESLRRSPLLCFFTPVRRGFLFAPAVILPQNAPATSAAINPIIIFLARGGAANWESL
jgi:hypothetical protein